MQKGLKFDIFFIGLLSFFIFVFYSLDIDLYKFFIEIERSASLKQFFINITEVGDSLWYFLFSIFFIIIFFFIGKKKNLIKYKNIFIKIYYLNIFLFLSVLFSGTITQILKHVIGRPRPNFAFIDNKFAFNLFTTDSNFHSFPSGHTSTIFAVSLVCALAVPKLKYFFFIFASIVAFSRIVVGSHFLTDVIGGVAVALIGFRISTIILYKFFNFNEKKESLEIITKNLNLVLIVITITAIFLSIGATFDIFLSSLFYQNSGLFFHEHSQFMLQSFYTITIFFRKIILPLILIYILILPIISLFVPLKQLYFGYSFKIKDIFFIWISTVLSLVLFINLILKNFWGRARPNEIYDLGGNNYFTPWYQISKQCITNCSFVSGDAAVGFALIIFFFLIKKEIYLWLAFILGLVLGLVRILEGAHFFSDIILSCLIVFVLNLVFYTYYMKKINV